MTTDSAFHRPRGTLTALLGKALQGGCEDCNAYQELDQIAPGIYGLTVRHDHTCPTLRRIIAHRDKENQ